MPILKQAYNYLKSLIKNTTLRRLINLDASGIFIVTSRALGPLDCTTSTIGSTNHLFLYPE
jgi:hypothetical protein